MGRLGLQASQSSLTKEDGLSLERYLKTGIYTLCICTWNMQLADTCLLNNKFPALFSSVKDLLLNHFSWQVRQSYRESCFDRSLNIM